MKKLPLFCLAFLLLTTANTSLAMAVTSTTPTTAVPGAEAWIIVDADSGVVLAGKNTHVLYDPASVTKLLTALTAVANLPSDALVPVSQRAVDMPAHKIGMKFGDQWKLTDMLHALLMSSANDAGMALAERISGKAEDFHNALSIEAKAIGLQDNPVLQDPSGLDDQFSIAGGNSISVHDIAIISRAVLAEPELRAIVKTRVYYFTDPHGGSHRLLNHNKLLGVYPGTIGLKTGYTFRSSHTFSVAATRNGRTILVAMEQASNPNLFATQLLNRGFSINTANVVHPDVLPAVRVPQYGVARAQLTTKIKRSSPATVNTRQIVGGVLVAFTVIGLFRIRRKTYHGFGHSPL